MFYIDNMAGRVNRCFIITGMSGAGKSATLNIFEDQGMFAVDNIPPSLIPQLLNVLSRHRLAVDNGLAAVVDVRGGDLMGDLLSVLEDLRKSLSNIKLIFLDADNDVLVRRFGATRRRHPLSHDLTTLDGVNMERKLLSPIFENADIILNTSDLNLKQLRNNLMSQLGYSIERATMIFTSFGYKYGIPQDCDFILDVRFLPNPHYISDLRPYSGEDEPVSKYIWSFSETEGFLQRFTDLLDYIIPLYMNTGKQQIHIGIGCTGGRHRSVAVARWLGEYFKGPRQHCLVRHRDIEREKVL